MAFSIEMGLTTRDRSVLDLEREWWQHAGTKERVIRERLDCSPAAYYSALRRLVGSDDAFAYDPLVVRRLKRRLERRRRALLETNSAARHRPS
ncbi:MAG: DUF3263 domain-containing protein [Acidimicrobiales bacterium]